MTEDQKDIIADIIIYAVTTLTALFILTTIVALTIMTKGAFLVVVSLIVGFFWAQVRKH